MGIKASGGNVNVVLSTLALSPTEDRWAWEPSTEGVYPVKSKYDLVLNNLTSMFPRAILELFALDK